MTTWKEIYGLDDPVVGDVGEFERATQHFDTMAQRATDVIDSVSAFTNGTSRLQFEGEAADAFASILGELDTAICAVPPVIRDVRDIFQTHAAALRGYHEQAAEALARATSRWRDLQNAEEDAAANRSTAADLQSQLDYLSDVASPDDAAASAEISVVSARLEHARVEESDAHGRAQSAQLELEGIRETWQTLKKREENRNSNTVARLDTLDLRGLADRNAAQRLYDSFQNFIDDPLGFVADVLKSIETFLGDALWLIKEVLEIVAVVLLVVALFVPGLNVLVFSVALALLAANLALWATQHPSPFTGETVSGGDVLWSTLAVVTSGAGLYLASRTGALISSGRSLIAGGLDGGRMARLAHISDQVASLRKTKTFVDAVGLIGDGKGLIDEGGELWRSAWSGESTVYQIPLSMTGVSAPASSVSFSGGGGMVEISSGGFVRTPEVTWTSAAAHGQCRFAPVEVAP